MSTLLPLTDKNPIIKSTSSLVQIPQGRCVGDIGYGTATAVHWQATRSSGLFSWYSEQLENHPLMTKMSTFGLVTFLSNAIAQLLQGISIFHLNWYQMFSKMLIGMMLTAPMYHFLYRFLEEYLPSTERNNRFIHLIVDQLIAVPVWAVCFITLEAVLSGPFTVFSMIYKRFQRDFRSMLYTSWIIYPIIQYLNFTYVPVKYRVCVLIWVGVVFNTTLSYLSSKAGQGWKFEQYFIQ